MLALGIILILLAVGAFAAVLGSGTDETATLFDGNVELPTMVLFLAGAVAMLLFVMGLELARSGVRRANDNRRTRKRLRALEQRQQGRDADTRPVAAEGTGDDTATTASGSTTSRPEESGESHPAPPDETTNRR